MDVATRRLVEERAAHRCEYCRLPQSAAPFVRFHVDHVTATQHGRDDTLDNLALACPHCNCRKGPNLASIDPATGGMVALFNPRLHAWNEHFTEVEGEIVVKTPIGRATARLLAMNDDEQLLIRAHRWNRGPV